MLLIRTVSIPVNGEWVKRDVLIDNGVYQRIDHPGRIPISEGCRIVQGDERFLVPAFIDPHVHVREPGYDYKEDWETCSKAALKGGVSTIFDMPNNRIPVTDRTTLRTKRAIALKKSYADFGLYIALTEENGEELKRRSIQRAICGIKVYFAKTTGSLLVHSEETLLDAFDQPKPVLIHTGGREGLEKALWVYQRASRKFSQLPLLYICHTSTADEVHVIKKWKSKFNSIVAEVTPHHLFLAHESYRGYPRVLPPLASRKDIDSLWEGISDGTIDLLGTDHAPHTVKEKAGYNPPAGFPGLETALPLLFSALEEEKIGLKTLIGLTSSRAREVFSLPSTYKIAQNEPAECVLIEKGEYTIGDDGYYSKCGWSPYHGWKVQWRPVMTILRGNIVYEHGKFHKYPVRDICCQEGN